MRPLESHSTTTAEGLRVGYVLTMFPRFSETFILNEVLALEAADVDVRIFSMRAPDDGRFHAALGDLRAPVTYLTRTPKASTLWSALGRAYASLPRLADPVLSAAVLDLEVEEGIAALEVAAAAVEQGIDHLHAHFANGPATVARLAARIAGIGYSLTAHAKDIFHDGLDADALQANLAQASAVITVSEFNVAFLQRLCPAANVVRIYNGLDLERFAFRAEGRVPRTVSAVGRLVPKKGFDVLLEATALLARSGDPLRVRLVGAGAEEQRLRELARRLGVVDRVEFCGALPQDRMKEVVATSAVFAAPCVVAGDGNRDGLPTVLLEALALGTACVATPVTGIPEAIIDRSTGRLVPESDVPALAHALRELLDDAGERERYARAGRALVEEHFDVRRNARALSAVFASLAATDPARESAATPALATVGA